MDRAKLWLIPFQSLDPRLNLLFPLKMEGNRIGNYPATSIRMYPRRRGDENAALNRSTEKGLKLSHVRGRESRVSMRWKLTGISPVFDTFYIRVNVNLGGDLTLASTPPNLVIVQLVISESSVCIDYSNNNINRFRNKFMLR